MHTSQLLSLNVFLWISNLFCLAHANPLARLLQKRAIAECNVVATPLTLKLSDCIIASGQIRPVRGYRMNEFLTFGPPIEANVPFRILNWIHGEKAQPAAFGNRADWVHVETCIITMITTNDSLQVARWSDIIAAADQIMSSCVTRYSWGGNVELGLSLQLSVSSLASMPS